MIHKAWKTDNLDILRAFISSRKADSSLADKLHAIWCVILLAIPLPNLMGRYSQLHARLCIQILSANERLLERGTEQLLELSRDGTCFRCISLLRRRSRP